LVVPAGLGRRVCGVAVKAERPQAKPRTNGLEGGVVRAMLVEPGRRNVRNQRVGRVLTTARPRYRQAKKVRLPVIHPPGDTTVNMTSVGGMVRGDQIGRGQSSPRLRRQLSGAKPPPPDRQEVDLPASHRSPTHR